MKLKKVAAYVRVSTNEQAKKGFSIEGQKRDIVDYCNYKLKEGYNIDFFVDEGKSAKTMNRKSLKQLMNEVNNYDYVVAWKIDRIGRGVLNNEIFRKEVTGRGACLLFVLDNIDLSTDSGVMQYQIISAVSENEIANTSTRTKMGLLQKARKGEYPYGNKPPIGFSKDKHHRLYYNNEIEIIRELYDLYVNYGYSFEFIAYLFRDKYPQYKWGKNYPCELLKKTIYRGYLEVQGERFDLVDPFFSEEEIEKLKFLENRSRVITDNFYKYKGLIFYKNQEMCAYTKNKKMKDGKMKKYVYYYVRINGKKVINIAESVIDKEVFKYERSVFQSNIDARQKLINNLEILLKQGRITNKKYDYLVSQKSHRHFSISRINVMDKNRIIIDWT